MTPDNALTILDLAVPGSPGDLRRAFRLAAHRSHPNKTKRKDSSAFREAKEAYDLPTGARADRAPSRIYRRHRRRAHRPRLIAMTRVPGAGSSAAR